LKVLINGLGLAAAKHVKEKRFDTYGYDINEAMEIEHKRPGITGNRFSYSRHTVGGRIL
jgi:hypothetical protein